MVRAASLCSLLLAGGCVSFHAPARFGLPADDTSADLSAVWVGHATVLVRMGPRRMLTDPNLNGKLYVLPRETPASLRPREVPSVDVILISHLHFDHFDRWTLARLPREIPIVFPAGSRPYVANLGRTKALLGPWERVHRNGLHVTAVPVAHFGGRYGFDSIWNAAYTGYVVEGFGRTVFFAGDTGYDEEMFREIGRRFPNIDLALIPIAPYRSEGGSAVHVDPVGALRIFRDVGARHMMPIHFEAYYGFMTDFSEPRQKLDRLIESEDLRRQVHPLVTGERLVISRQRDAYVIRGNPGAEGSSVSTAP